MNLWPVLLQSCYHGPSTCWPGPPSEFCAPRQVRNGKNWCKGLALADTARRSPAFDWTRWFSCDHLSTFAEQSYGKVKNLRKLLSKWLRATKVDSCSLVTNQYIWSTAAIRRLQPYVVRLKKVLPLFVTDYHFLCGLHINYFSSLPRYQYCSGCKRND